MKKFLLYNNINIYVKYKNKFYNKYNKIFF